MSQESKNKNWVMAQRWQHVLFLHFKVSAEEVQKLLPEGLHCDTFQEQAYVSIVPFVMDQIRLKWTPRLPFSKLNELNRLFTESPQGILRGQVLHNPWPLEEARIESFDNEFTASLGFDLGKSLGHSFDCAAYCRELSVRFRPFQPT